LWHAQSALAAGYRDNFDEPPAGAQLCKYWCIDPVTPYGGTPEAYHPTDEMFDTIFRRDHLSISGGIMTLTFDDCPNDKAACQEWPYASGEYESLQSTTYGCYSGRMKAVSHSGVVSSMFTYNADPWDEIDIEFPGKDTTMIQTGYFVGGRLDTDSDGNNIEQIPLGFDASKDFHVYQIEWNKDSIAWFVDGKEIRRASDGPMPSAPSQLMANLWTGKKAEQFFGPFTYSGPITAQYDWLAFNEGPCTPPDLTGGETTPAPVTGKQCYCVKK